MFFIAVATYGVPSARTLPANSNPASRRVQDPAATFPNVSEHARESGIRKGLSRAPALS